MLARSDHPDTSAGTQSGEDDTPPRASSRRRRCSRPRGRSARRVVPRRRKLSAVDVSRRAWPWRRRDDCGFGSAEGSGEHLGRTKAAVQQDHLRPSAQLVVEVSHCVGVVAGGSRMKRRVSRRGIPWRDLSGSRSICVSAVACAVTAGSPGTFACQSSCEDSRRAVSENPERAGRRPRPPRSGACAPLPRGCANGRMDRPQGPLGDRGSLVTTSTDAITSWVRQVRLAPDSTWDRCHVGKLAIAGYSRRGRVPGGSVIGVIVMVPPRPDRPVSCRGAYSRGEPSRARIVTWRRSCLGAPALRRSHDPDHGASRLFEPPGSPVYVPSFIVRQNRRIRRRSGCASTHRSCNGRGSRRPPGCLVAGCRSRL